MNKAELHEAMLRAGFFLPSIGSTIVSKKWLEKVLTQHEWCPKYTEVRLRPYTRPPLKSFLITKIQKILKSKNLSLSISEKKNEPDLEWLKSALSTLNPEHLYFQKSYFPSDAELGLKEKKSSKKEVDLKKLQLLQGLPPQLFSKTKSKTNYSYINKEN